MRFVHTSDWHLGRLFHGVHLTDDQAHTLDDFLRLVRDVRPDAVLIAGDVYDRAVPPPEAVMLLDDVLTRLAVECRTRVVVIAGNHDGPDRLAFGGRLLAGAGVHVVGTLRGGPCTVPIDDAHGTVHVVPWPYAEPATVTGALGPDADASGTDHAAALRRLVGWSLPQVPAGARAVAVAHVFAHGGEESPSERPLAIGGASMVDLACLARFQYVALGHLHRPQAVGAEHVRYSGSLLKYSFAEATQRKSVCVVEMDAAGACRIEAIGLRARRDVRVVQGRLAEILTAGAADAQREDYVQATLLDRGPVLDAMARLRAVYPNCLHVDRSAWLTPGDQSVRGGDHRARTDLELFDGFFREVTGAPLTDAERTAFARIATPDPQERDA